MTLASQIDRLFELPPEAFVAARDDLAERLRREGDAEGAKRVKALRRPTVAAWATNRLVRSRPRELDSLLQAGEELRRAQRTVLSGGNTDLGAAAERRRAAVAALVRAAQELLASVDRDSEATRRAVEATLDAASIDEEAAEVVRGGRLSKELPPPVGFGTVAGFRVLPGPEETEAPKGRPGRAARDGRDRDRAVAAEREEAARRAAREADQAERRATRARDRAARLRRQAEEAERKAELAEAEARGAEAEARRLRRGAERTRP